MASKNPESVMTHRGDDVVIVGAGLVGSLMGLALQGKGYKVTIYERYPDIRSIPSLGRSINLVLTSRGMRAIRMLGDESLVRDLNEMSVPVTGRIMHQMGGEKVFQRYGKDDSEFNLSISRFELNKYLIAKADAAGCKLLFGHQMTGCIFPPGHDDMVTQISFNVLDVKGGRTDAGVKSRLVATCDCPVLGADGAGSRLRYALRDAGFCSFTEDFCPQGYKELMFPIASCQGQLARHGLHIWPRDTHFLMALANLDGSFTGTIYVDSKGAESFASLTDAASVTAFFRKYYPTAIPLLGGLDTITKQMVSNPTGLLGTVTCDRFHHRRLLLIGDASHAITPFFGQGTNSGFEDTVVLSRLFAQHCPPSRSKQGMARAAVATCFAAFTAARKENTDAIADMALDNFVEMRERVGDKRFLLMKGIENALENRFPACFRSRYAMVCYGGGGGITYSAALKLGGVQWAIIEDLLRGDASLQDPEKVDFEAARRLIEQRLVPLQRRLGVDLSQISHDVGQDTAAAHGPSARL